MAKLAPRKPVRKPTPAKAAPRPAARPTGIAALLANSQADWNNSEARTFGAPLPDGIYEGIIEASVIETSRPPRNRLQVRWDLLVTSGECEGRQIRKYNGLETADNMAWFKGDLETLGLEIPSDIADLGNTLESAQGMKIRFQVRSKDEFTNIDFIEPLEASEEASEVAAEEAAPEVAGTDYTKADIKKMDKGEVKALAKELGLDPSEYDAAELRDAVIDMLDLS